MLRRRYQALELRKAGMSYRAIAAALQVSQTQARRDVKQALGSFSRQDRIDQMRMLESERLDLAILAIARSVKQGNLSAIDRWLKLSESRRKLLGLDAEKHAQDPAVQRRVVRMPLKGPSE